MKTTDERPHLRRGLPGRGVSPIGWLRTELAIGNQVHTPLRRSQERQTRPASPLSRQRRVSVARRRARPRSLPKRAHPARQAHQPLGPGTASRPPSSNYRAAEVSPGGVDAFLSGPSTQGLTSPPTRRAPTLTGRKPSRRRAPQLALGVFKASPPSPLTQSLQG